MAEQREDAGDMAEALCALGELQEDKGDLQEAERLYRESLASYRNEDERAVMGAPARVALGRLLAQRGALDEAEQLLLDTLETGARVGLAPDAQARARKVLAEVQERRGDLPATIEQLREVIRIEESTAQSGARNDLSQVELRAQMRAARREAEDHRLRYVELSQMQAKLVESEKMAQLGRLAAGTAHELNSPLGVLRSNMSVYRRAAERLHEIDRREGSGDEHSRKLATALEACILSGEAAIARLAAVGDNLMRFTQLDLAEKRRFDVVEGLQSTVALVRPNVPEQVEIETRFEQLPEIAGWPGQLNQAFMTVLLNALEAIDGAGKVTVEASAADGGVVVKVRDTGRGMDEDQRANLFDVGWSADGKRTKMRLGLSAAHATVQRHGGQITVTSEPGQGTEVRFTLPIAGHFPN
jgi:signal transduction histidine kinase